MSETKSFTIKHYLPYVAVLLLFGGGIWLILTTGEGLYSQPVIAGSSAESVFKLQPEQGGFPTSNSPLAARPSEAGRSFANRIFHENLRNSLSILLLQLVVIIVAARLVGRLFRKIAQPPVLGEIVAGIVLGPSLLGWISPPTMAFLFPPASMETLKLLSQIGVALFMFVVGMELDVQHLRKKAHAAVMVSNASIIVPFFLGAALSLLLYRALAPAGTSFTAFALFMGIAMSITAFPVLARILEDRGMSQTYLGSVALTCAAVDDVTAWCMLALVIAVAQSGGVAASFLTIAFTLTFIGFMLLLVKPQLARLLTSIAKSGAYSRGLVAGILAFVFACALVTEAIGIHALFGAFLAGVAMPATGGLRVLLKERLETFSAAALLPLFFAFTGLRMQVGLLNDWQSWIMCAVIVVVAIAGKLAQAC